MNYNSVMSVLYRVFTFGALALIALAVLESLANGFGYSLVHESYRPGRLIEFAAMSAVLASALLLRQIREELRKKPSA
jgi:hypothetical protein